MKLNNYDHKIPQISETVSDPMTRSYLQKILEVQLGLLGVANPEGLTQIVLTNATNLSQEDYETESFNLLKNEGVLENVKEQLKNRSLVIYNEVKPYVQGTKVLDYGCGNGIVGQMLADDGFKIVLSDVYPHPELPKDLPYFDVSELKSDEQYDTVLLATVLHHADNAIEVFKHAISLTKKGGRLILVESIHGVKNDKEISQLNLEQQWNAAAFIDHFANRVLYDPKNKINVPYNFKTPEEWQKTFSDLGLKLLAAIDLGLDLPVFPEYHYLFVVEK
ncbi:MAG: methyltransferase domain-containing protein [Candidatus Uhrbacteria bacterium]